MKPTPMTARLRSCFSALSMALVCLAPGTILAEDIDIYSPRADADFRPKMIIGVDTSASMRFTGDAWAKWRLDRLKEPLIDFLRTTDGIDVGLSTFNGVNRGGAVVSPARQLDEDLCPEDACGEISIRTQILREMDDGHELESTGRLGLTSAGGSLGQRIDDRSSQGHYLDVDGQSYLQTTSGLIETEILPFSTTEDGSTAEIGLHFPYFTIPSNAELSNVRVYFEWAGQEWLDADLGEGSGIASTQIHIDSRTDSPPFADVDGERVSDRPLHTESVAWNVRRPSNWQGLNDSSTIQVTPNLKDQFLGVFGPGYRGPVTFVIKPDPAASLSRTDSIVLLGSHSRGSQLASPRLVLGYRIIDRAPIPYTNGFRFDSVNVPPGATITSAWMEVAPRGSERPTEASFSIRADDSDDAADFTYAYTGLTGRPSTSAQVAWSPPSWTGVTDRQRTPDLSAVVQEIVDRPGWCAGAAMAMLVEGEGERFIYMYRAGAYRAASLHISYEPASVDRSKNCTTVSGSDVRRYRSSGDAVQKHDGTVSLNETVYDPGDPDENNGVRSYLGVRFSDIQLEQGAPLGDVRLLLSAETDGRQHSIVVVVDDDNVAAAPYAAGVPFVSERFGADPYNATLHTHFAEGALLESADLSSLLQPIIDSPDWKPGSDLYMRISPSGGQDGAPIRTSLSQDGTGPQLRIATRIEAPAAANIPFRTVRDELVEQVQVMPAVGNTPFVNLLEESARYLLGEDVLHGKRRGEQNAANLEHRLSDPRTYERGTVTRPVGCSEDNPSAAECVGEEIRGPASYIAPESSECKANQIVLLTDGAPTPSTAGSGPTIRSMTGLSCAGNDPAVECAIEFAGWLNSDSGNRDAIRTSAIGFDFASQFLEDLTGAGGGNFYSASSSGQVGDALRRISASTIHQTSSFTSPVPAVSQYGRAYHRSDIYLSQFKPEAGAVVWSGNIKRYGLGAVDDVGAPAVLDANGKPLMLNGKIDGSARSFWSETADGADILKGGAASRLTVNRTLLTYPGPSNGANHGARNLVPFAVEDDQILAADLGVPPEARTAAIGWMRGLDTLDEDGDGLRNEPRRTLGSAIHTNATTVSYASVGGADRTLLFAGTQEGYLHAIDTANGSEVFGFLPQELYSNVGPFFRGDSNEFRHGLDGPITTWMSDENGNRQVDSGESAYLVVGMRRGGSHYYALDISDPDDPSLLWSLDPGREGFEGLGQSWSRPALATLREGTGADVTVRQVLVFGNGYHASNDAPTRSLVNHDDKGAIFFVDAMTGELVQRIDQTDHPEMVWSIAADVVPVDIDFDGVTDTVIAADLGGNVWRLDMGFGRDAEGSMAAMPPQPTLVARLADRPLQWATPTGATNDGGDRRFFHAPDVALIKSPAGGVSLGVTLGSGRRDSPLESDTTNRIYMLFLSVTEPSTSAIAERDLFDATSESASIPSGSRGWFIDLPATGEKMLGTPLILQNRVIATSYVPPQTVNPDPCAVDLGGGRLYVLDVASAAGMLDTSGPDEPSVFNRSTDLGTDGIPASVTAYIGEDNPDTPTLLVGTSVIEGAAVSTPATLRTYWVEE